MNYWKNRQKDEALLFSIVPYLDAKGVVIFYENKLSSDFGFNTNLNSVVPDRIQDDIKSFSKKSRLRLFNLLTSINYSSYGFPLFVSATWHFDSPSNRNSLKQFLELYTKRLKRQLPAHHVIWKFEYQKRGVPHFHFMLLPLNPQEDFLTDEIKNIIERNWKELKLCKCKHCEKYSIKTVRMNDFKHAMIYISKEIAKQIECYEKHNLGRVWGASRNIRKVPVQQIKCKYSDFRKFLSSIHQKEILKGSAEIQLIAMKDFALDSSLWINFDEIKYLFLEWLKELPPENAKQFSPAYKKLILRQYKFCD